MAGNCKGTIIKGNLEYLKKKHGTDGVQAVLKDMKKKGFKFDPADIKDGKWYPMEIRLEILRSTVEILDLDEEDIKLVGATSARLSTISALYMKLLAKPKTIFKLSKKVYLQNYDQGEFESLYNGPKGSFFMMKGLDSIPYLCPYLMGYWGAVFAHVGVKDVKIEEIKCVHRGDDIHEFKFTW